MKPRQSNRKHLTFSPKTILIRRCVLRNNSRGNINTFLFSLIESPYISTRTVNFAWAVQTPQFITQSSGIWSEMFGEVFVGFRCDYACSVNGSCPVFRTQPAVESDHTTRVSATGIPWTYFIWFWSKFWSLQFWSLLMLPKFFKTLLINVSWCGVMTPTSRGCELGSLKHE